MPSSGSAAFQSRGSEPLMGRFPRFAKKVCPPEVIPLLGKVSDRQIAREQGCHSETVQVWRGERGIEPWHQSKQSHEQTCDWCQKPFVIVGGQADRRRRRRTCPPPKKCQWKQAHKTRMRSVSQTNMKQLKGLLERHVLTDK